MPIQDTLKTIYLNIKPYLRFAKPVIIPVYHYLKFLIIKMRYASHLQKLKKIAGKRAINVGFLVNEEAKWQYQSLYDEFENSKWFKPVVLISDLYSGESRLEHYKSFQEHCIFFEKLGLRAEKNYNPDTKTYKSPKDFDIDILFYQQPWGLPEIHTPMEVSKYALTCYVPYGFQSSLNPGMYMDSFHKLIWKNFVQGGVFFEDMKKLAKRNINNCVPVGYTKLDTYINITATSVPKKKIVIYAPHHSFEENGLRFATFQYNGREILKFAQKYSDVIHWVFKPHPRFKHAVIKNEIMTEAEIISYYEGWEKIGEVYDSANYESLFVQSSAMITDCCSFLGEYAATKHPIFHLWNDSALYGSGMRDVSSSFYRIKSIESLMHEFDRVVIGGDDYKKCMRLEKVVSVFGANNKCSRIIVNAINNYIN